MNDQPQQSDAENAPTPAGGLGGGAGTEVDQRTAGRDLRLIRMAINRKWNIRDEAFDALPNVMLGIALNKEFDPRARVSAGLAVVKMNDQNLAIERPEDNSTTVHIGLNLATLRQELLGSERHLDHPPADGDPGEVREICEQGPLANGSAPRAPESGHNGHHNGNGRH